jgi:4-hydroxy-4-methyl-2-oxoglutarate aldolase
MTDNHECATSDVSDACDALGVTAVRTGVLGPAWPGAPALAGVIHTIRLEPAPGAGSPLPELLDFLSTAADGLVLVDLGARSDYQCWGEVLATSAMRFGVRGALVNGAIRDVEALRSLGFPVHARGVYPAAIKARLRVAEVGAPVVIDHKTIEDGTFAVADESGLVAFAVAECKRVLSLATDRRRAEGLQLDEVRGGRDPRDVFGPA